MKNLTQALIALKSASIGQIRAYADEAQNNAHHAAAPFRWIAFYSEVERASELFRALAEGWRRCLEYFEGFDPMMEAQMILDLMAARITLKLEDDDDDDEGGAE